MRHLLDHPVRCGWDKDGYVLHMLRPLMWTSKDGDQPFQAMMQEFVRTDMNRNMSTGRQSQAELILPQVGLRDHVAPV